MGSKKKAAKPAPKKSKKPKTAVKKTKLIMVSLKLSPSELKALKLRAKWHAKGNFSAWIRHAGIRYRPKSGEKILGVAAPSAKSIIERHYKKR